MKIVIATCGTRGDVQPIIALSTALKAAGHRVVVAAPPENRQWIASFGLAFFPLGDRFTDFVARHPDVHALSAGPAFVRFLRRQARLQFQQLPQIVRGSDLALGCSLAYGLPSAAEAFSVPYRYIAFCPQVLRSAEHPSVFVRLHGMPAVLNRLTWKIDALADRLLFRPALDRCRRQAGLPPVSGPTLEHLLGTRPFLAAEPVLAPLPADAVQTVVPIGSLALSGAKKLGAAVASFLDDGPPPLYFGFGSMPYADREKTAAMVSEAARAANLRAILSMGIEKRAAGDLLFVGAEDHGRLFERVAVVIHHGGAGTTATAARAGTPQILAPHVLDQFYWARRVWRMGLGPAPLDARRLKTEELLDRIRKVVEQPGFARRAQAVATPLRGRRGLEAAVSAVEAAASTG